MRHEESRAAPANDKLKRLLANSMLEVDAMREVLKEGKIGAVRQLQGLGLGLSERQALKPVGMSSSTLRYRLAAIAMQPCASA